MALRIAVPNFPLEQEEPTPNPSPVSDARERRIKLDAYLALDPAIRFLIALALVAAISLLYLVQASTVTELNYDVQRQAVEYDKLVRERQQLQIQIAHAQALPQIEQIARTKLKMVPVGDQYRYLQVPAANGMTDAGGAPAAGAPQAGAQP
jgi:cell division protein FtsB